MPGTRRHRADHGHRPLRLPQPGQQPAAFPGIFRGALDAARRAQRSDEAGGGPGIADVVPEDHLSEDYIVPSVFDREVAPKVAKRWSRRPSATASPASTRRPGPSPPWRSADAVKVLVTGASGLIGSALCDSLLARGDEVVGLTRDPERRAAQTRRMARLGADAGTTPGSGLRRRRRSSEPGRREDRPALDRRGEAEDHGEPPHRHPQPGARSPGWSEPRCWSTSRRSATTEIAARRSSTSGRGGAPASTPRWCRSRRGPHERPNERAFAR